MFKMIFEKSSSRVEEFQNDTAVKKSIWRNMFKKRNCINLKETDTPEIVAQKVRMHIAKQKEILK